MLLIAVFIAFAGEGEAVFDDDTIGAKVALLSLSSSTVLDERLLRFVPAAPSTLFDPGDHSAVAVCDDIVDSIFVFDLLLIG